MSVLTAQRMNTPSWTVSTVWMFSIKLKSANHSPKLLNRSSLDLVEATTSQNSGSRKYPRQTSMKTVSSQLVGFLGGAGPR